MDSRNKGTVDNSKIIQLTKGIINKRKGVTIMKIYKAMREFIESNKDTKELYELEGKMNDAIKEVIEWRKKHFEEKYWEEALPQTLLTILEMYDRNASEVSARCFLEVPSKDYGKGITKKA